jgi:hypothetical protein
LGSRLRQEDQTQVGAPATRPWWSAIFAWRVSKRLTHKRKRKRKMKSKIRKRTKSKSRSRNTR